MQEQRNYPTLSRRDLLRLGLVAAALASGLVPADHPTPAPVPAPAKKDKDSSDQGEPGVINTIMAASRDELENTDLKTECADNGMVNLDFEDKTNTGEKEVVTTLEDMNSRVEIKISDTEPNTIYPGVKILNLKPNNPYTINLYDGPDMESLKHPRLIVGFTTPSCEPQK